MLKFLILEKTYKKRLKYLYFKKRSDTLLVCFAAFPPGNIRVYNNVKGFKDLDVDRLYISDTFGYKGSYYLFENGNSEPFLLTDSFIKSFIGSGKYRHVYMAGTSKGGSCAIMFGLRHKAEKIFAGACQYHLGTYLNTPDRYKVFEGMMGVNASLKEQQKLDAVMPGIIEENKNSSSEVYILYSKQEHTYKDDIEDLLHDLKRDNIRVIEKEEFFTNHGEVGRYFIPYVKSIVTSCNK